MLELTAYSEKTGHSYPNFAALVQAEANGWVCVVVLRRGGTTWPWVIGPFDSKAAALRAKGRATYKFKRQREQRELPENLAAKFFVRPAWKDDES